MKENEYSLFLVKYISVFLSDFNLSLFVNILIFSNFFFQFLHIGLVGSFVGSIDTKQI